MHGFVWMVTTTQVKRLILLEIQCMAPGMHRRHFCHFRGPGAVLGAAAGLSGSAKARLHCKGVSVLPCRGSSVGQTQTPPMCDAQETVSEGQTKGASARAHSLWASWGDIFPPWAQAQAQAQARGTEAPLSPSAGAVSVQERQGGLCKLPTQILGGAEWRSGSVLGP